MSDSSARRDLAYGEACSKIHWGADGAEVMELLRTNYGIEGDEADEILSAAIVARRSAIRKKAVVALIFAVIGLAIPAGYFAIQGFVGFVVIGFGPVLMGLWAIASLALMGRSIYRLISADVSGPV